LRVFSHYVKISP